MEKNNLIFLSSEPKKIKADQEKKLLQEFSRLQLTGESPAFIKTISSIKKISSFRESVLIQGETGTGKEASARAIHYLSDRRDYGFIPINCAAIPDELFERELFGFEKGKFTDANTKEMGLLSLAQCGSLFLDAAESLTPTAQAALLHFLKNQEYRASGSKVTLQADVRVLAATNVNLKQLTEQKKFSADLYSRLNVLNVEIPPLRNRRQDIPLIAAALIEKFTQQYRADIKKIHPDSIHFLMQQPWTGNIRELENTLLRHFLASSDSTLIIENTQHTEEDKFIYPALKETHHIGKIGEPQKNCLIFQDAKAQAISDFEAHYLKEIMAKTDRNTPATAGTLAEERRALGKLLQNHLTQRNSTEKTMH